jgi:hypothetical protein
MAPLAITIKNKSVMIPVILYRMLMATAVVGGGPPGLASLAVPLLALEEFTAIVAGKLLFGWRLLNNVFESWDEIIE